MIFRELLTSIDEAERLQDVKLLKGADREREAVKKKWRKFFGQR